jgi:hypothetical protein
VRPAVDEDERALFAECKRDRAPNAATCASDKDNFVGEGLIANCRHQK